LVSEKEEGKKPREGKEDGMGNFPLFGTNEKEEGKKDVGRPHTKMVSAHNRTERIKEPIFLLKRQNSP
jgi:hypothetical protein